MSYEERNENTGGWACYGKGGRLNITFSIDTGGEISHFEAWSCAFNRGGMAVEIRGVNSEQTLLCYEAFIHPLSVRIGGPVLVVMGSLRGCVHCFVYKG